MFGIFRRIGTYRSVSMVTSKYEKCLLYLGESVRIDPYRLGLLIEGKTVRIDPYQR